MKKFLALLLVLVTILCLAACKPKDDPGLETDPVDTQPVDPNSLNLADMQIVLPVNATWVEQFAKTELVDHIEMMTGEYLDVVTEGEETGAAIYIGETDYAKSKNVTFTDNEYKEGWAIQAIDGNLVLRGGEVRGVLYAVYHLLEDVLGFHWWNYWDMYIPEGSPLVPKDYSDSGVPAMEYRALYISGANQKNPNLVRNRVNGCMDGLSDANGGSEAFGYPAHVHTLSRYFPIRYQDTTNEKKLKWIDLINPEHGDLIDTHTDWFAWDADTGTRLATGQMCLTNEEFYQTFEKALLGTIALDEEYGGGKHGRYYSITFNDTSGYCECATCVADVEKRGLSGHLMNFVNRLANAVKEAGYDDIYVETLCYQSYIEPPKDDTVPADNVKIRYANLSMDILHDIDHPNNAGFNSGLETWADLIPEGNMYVWDYGIPTGMNGIFPLMGKYGVNFAEYYQEGINGYFVELQDPIGTDFWDMKFWLITKLMEDPTLAMDEEGNYSQERYDALMDEFIYGYYGDAAGPYIREYLDYMYEKAVSTDTKITYHTYIIEGQWLTVEDILKGAELFDKAYEAAGNDKEVLERLRAASGGFDRVVIENWYKWKKQAEALGIEFTLDEQEIGGRLVKGLQEMNEERGGGEALLSRYERYRGITYSLPEELADIDPIHIHDYLAKTNSLMTNSHAFLKDPDSLVGEALTIHTGSMLEFNRYTFYRVDGVKNVGLNLLAPGGKSTPIGALGPNDIIADSKYHLYKFEDILIDHDLYNYLNVIARDGSIQNRVISEDMARLHGKYVDFYLSMKVTGNVTCTDPANYPSYYVDRIIIVEQCQVDRKYYNGDATCLEDGTLTGPCNICGKTVTVKDHGHPLGHSFTKYEMNADGYQTAYCDNGCGTPDNLTAGGNKIPDEAAAVHSCFYYRTTFDTWGNYGAGGKHGNTVYDSESLTNTVVKLDSSTKGWNRLWFQNTEAKGNNVAISVAYNEGYNNKKTNKILIPADQLAANNDGKYHTYKIENVVLVPKEATSINRVLMFGSDQLYTYDFAYVMYSNVKGKPVDIYLRMKYTGDPTGEDKTQPPVYWLEQMVVVNKEGKLTNVSENTATCTESGTQTGKCAICGSKQTTYASPKGHTPGQWQIVTEPTCKIEGLKITKCTVCGADVSEVIPKTDDHVLGDWAVMPNHTRTRLCVVCEAYGETEMLDSNPVGNELKNVHDCFAYELNFENIKNWQIDGLNLEVGHDPYSVLGESLKIDVQQAGSSKRFYLGANGLSVGVTHFPAAGGKAKTVTATIPGSELKQNQDGLYHFYKIEDTVLIPESAGDLVYMAFFGGNVLRNTSVGQDFFKQLKGKKADIYVSLRYTGNLETGENLVYHIDRIIIVNAEGAWKTMQTTATCTTAGTTSGTCKVCGTKLTITPPALGHSFTNYISNNDATCAQDGTKTAKCDRCDVTDTLPDEGSKKPHTFTAYTDNGNGTKTAKCDHCDAMNTVTASGSKVPDEVASVHECFYFRTTFGEGSNWITSGENITDGSALGGNVTKLDVNKFGRKDWFLNTATGTSVGILITLKGTDSVWVSIPADQLAANNDGKYHVYKMEDVVLIPNEATACPHVSLFNGTPVYNSTFGGTLYKNIKGKAVDIYLNMKYTGDISGADKNNYPVYYIDQLIVAASEGIWDESQAVNTATCTTPGTTTGACYHCGATLSVASSALGHSFTNYVSDNNATCTQDGTKTAKCDRCNATDTLVEEGTKSHTFTVYTDNGNGTKTAKCDNCDATDTKTLNGNDMPDEVAAMHNCFYFRTTFGEGSNWITSGENITDGSALGGNVTKIDVNKFGNKSWFLNTATRTALNITVNLKGTKSVSVPIPADQLAANNDGQYHIYKMEDVVLIPNEATDIAYVELFIGGVLYNKAFGGTLFENIKGKAVDVYLNMKYTGDISGADKNNYPVYYLDQLIVAASEGIWDESQAVNTATCTTPGTTTGACKHCGATLSLASSALGHSFTNYVPNNDATCDEDGTKAAKCDRCDATHTMIDEGSRKSHAFTAYTDNGNGTKTAKCDNCDATETKTLNGNDMPDEVAAMDASRYFRVTFGEGSNWITSGENITDGSALGGNVTKLDVNKFGRKDWFLNTATRTSVGILITLKGTNSVWVSIPADQLAANNDGKYHVYKMEDVVLIPNEATACPHVSLFTGTPVYNSAFGGTLYKNIKGKTVDVYLNMKYTGDISGADTSNYPVYYLDQLIVAATEG